MDDDGQKRIAIGHLSDAGDLKKKGGGVNIPHSDQSRNTNRNYKSEN
jgi:hypothetical protein